MKKTTSVLLAAALGLSAVDAMAAQPVADQGFYLLGAWGQAQADINNAQIDASFRALGAATALTTSDDRVYAWKIGAGYQFSRHFALEASYANFDDFSTTTTTTGPTGTFLGAIDGKAYSLDAVGILPVNPNFDLFAKVGLQYWDVDTRYTAVVGSSAAAINRSDDGTDWKFGVGARWNFTPSFGIQLEWERYNDVGNSNTTGKSDIDMVTVGLRWKF